MAKFFIGIFLIIYKKIITTERGLFKWQVKTNIYFEILVELVDYSCSAAALLNNTLLNFDANKIESKIKEMHEIEHNADIKKHDMMNRLAKEFITPIERGDIIELAHEIDNVADAIEDVLARIYMFNITSIREGAIEFSNIISKNCTQLKNLMEEFHSSKKSQKYII